MADYYDSFSFVLDLYSPAEADWWNRVLGRIGDSVDHGLPPEPDLDRLLASIPELEYSSDLGACWGIDCTVTVPRGCAGNAWFSCDRGNPNVVALAWILHAFLRRFDRTDGCGIEYSLACSKLRPDGFGGAAVWVTSHGCSWLSTHSWLERRAARHERRRKAAQAARTPRAASLASGPEPPGREREEEREAIRC